MGKFIHKHNKALCIVLWVIFFLSFSFVVLLHIAEIYATYQESINLQSGESLGLYSCGSCVVDPMVFILNVNIPTCFGTSLLLLFNSLFINKKVKNFASINALFLSFFILVSTFNKLYEYAVHSLAGEPAFCQVWWWFFDSIAK